MDEIIAINSFYCLEQMKITSNEGKVGHIAKVIIDIQYQVWRIEHCDLGDLVF